MKLNETKKSVSCSLTSLWIDMTIFTRGCTNNPLGTRPGFLCSRDVSTLVARSTNLMHVSVKESILRRYGYLINGNKSIKYLTHKILF